MTTNPVRCRLCEKVPGVVKSYTYPGRIVEHATPKTGIPLAEGSCELSSTTATDSRYQIDHRNSPIPTQADRTGATLLRKADWHYFAALPTEGVSPPASPDVTSAIPCNC
jgi:hypothetical protein